MARVPVTGIPQDGGAPVRAGVPEHGRVPKYYAVRIQLTGLVDGPPEGQSLPTGRELAERFGAARETVRQALRDPLLEGRLRRRGHPRPRFRGSPAHPAHRTGNRLTTRNPHPRRNARTAFTRLLRAPLASRPVRPGSKVDPDKDV